MSQVINSPLALCLALLAAWCLIGVAGLARPMSIAFAGRTLFPLGALFGAALAFVALASLDQPTEQLILPIGLPDLPAHLRLDALSRVFLLLLGAASAGISIFAAGYFRRGEGTPPGLLCVQYHLFLAAMGFVVLADDAYSFMLAWETMALASYFLVTTQHRIPEIRRAGFLYLLIAHLGAIFHSAVLRHPAGRQLAIHLRCHARRASRPGVGLARLLPGADRLWRQGGSGAAARLAAGSASRRALAGFRADERRHAEDGAVWNDSRELRSARRAGVVVGIAAALAGPVQRAVRRGVCSRADGYETSACLFLHREHRHRVHRFRACDRIRRRGHARRGGARP